MNRETLLAGLREDLSLAAHRCRVLQEAIALLEAETPQELAAVSAIATTDDTESFEEDFAEHRTFCGETGRVPMSRDEFRAFRARELARAGHPDGVAQDHEQRGCLVTPDEARHAAIRGR